MSSKKLARIVPDKAAANAGVTEKRRAERRPLTIAVTLKVPNLEAAVKGRSVNLSTGGIFIATKHPPPLGTSLDIEVELPDRRLILHARGNVVRHGEANGVPGVGVQFTDVSYEAQELIDEILAASPPEEPEPDGS